MMRHPETRLERITAVKGGRVLVTSDIHGHLSHLKRVLEMAHFSSDDTLVIVGDIVEKGPDSLGTLRYVMELCRGGNVIPLIGNVDAFRLRMIDDLDETGAPGFYHYLTQLRERLGTSFYDELAEECGYTLTSPLDVLRAKEDVISHFSEEFGFLADLPTAVELGEYIFVHGGLRDRVFEDNRSRSIWELTKYDGFMSETEHIFDKYVVVGHWPVSLYSDTVQKLSPIIDREKHIIAIDGGCGVKRDGQLNLLILPDAYTSAENITHVSYDALPKIISLEAQAAGGDSVHICWHTRQVEMICRGEEFSLVRHTHSGREIEVPNAYLIDDTQCRDCTDRVLEVSEGDVLSLIFETSRGCIVKKNGEVGWYAGAWKRA